VIQAAVRDCAGRPMPAGIGRRIVAPGQTAP
jgi:hypothetical protein